MYTTLLVFYWCVHGIDLDLGTSNDNALVLMLTSKGIAGVQDEFSGCCHATCGMFDIPIRFVLICTN
jgi:Na+/H+-dicarboxylate symporter